MDLLWRCIHTTMLLLHATIGVITDHGPAAERAVLYPISGSSEVYAMNYELNKNFNRILSFFRQQVYKMSLEDLCKLAVVTTLSLTMKCVLFKCVK